MNAAGRFNDPRQFERLVIKRGGTGSRTRWCLLGDVGRAELGAEDYSVNLRFNGRDAVGIGIFQLPDANTLALEAQVRAQLEKLAAAFPPSMKYKIAFNPTDAVRASIGEVMKTLFEAIVLVILVIFLFLQDWRATVIPAVTIPVSLVGTFAFIKAFGFSINTLTLFGIVLATGLVVDDAIVVVENISRNLSRAARRRARRRRERDGRGGGRGHRDLAGADRGLRSGGVHLGHDRPAVPAVLADHRLLGGDLGLQRADAVAGAGGAADARPARGRVAVLRLPLVQPRHGGDAQRTTAARSAGCWGTWC